MQNKKLTIINKLGLHARASMQLVNRACRYESSIKIQYNDKEVDAKDIMSVMVLAASKGAEIELITSGPDEVEAMQAIEELIGQKFGEDE